MFDRQAPGKLRALTLVGLVLGLSAACLDDEADGGPRLTHGADGSLDSDRADETELASDAGDVPVAVDGATDSSEPMDDADHDSVTDGTRDGDSSGADLADSEVEEPRSDLDLLDEVHCSRGEVQSCGQGIGLCQRGIRVCRDDLTLSGCVLSTEGSSCTEGEGCERDEWCVDEVLHPYEDIAPDDECLERGDEACRRSICRGLLNAGTCSDDGDCSPAHECLFGSCRQLAVEPGEEVCNGFDDDCDGRIDNSSERICGACPFGMTLFDESVGGRPSLCIDTYEASRPDATSASAGASELYALSRAGVMPWTGLAGAEEAEQICEAQLLRAAIPGALPARFLCTQSDLEAVCGDAFPYGETFIAGRCGDATTGDEPSPTGRFAGCCTEDGVCDLSGNVAEMFRFPVPGLFGGSREDSGGEALGCASWELLAETDLQPTSVGFRCCVLPSE